MTDRPYDGRVLVEAKVQLNRCMIMPDIFVGYRSYANETVVRSRTRIGRYCSIGRRCTINAGAHPTSWLTTHPIAFEAGFRRADVRSPPNRFGRTETRLGNDVWIGDNALVMSGVEIGTGAVVGGGSVVTRDVEAYSIVAGSPARVVRFRFTEVQIERLLSSSWWNYDEEILRGLSFDDIDRCLDELASRISSGRFSKNETAFHEWTPSP